MKRDEDSIAIVTAFVVTEGDYFLFFFPTFFSVSHPISITFLSFVRTVELESAIDRTLVFHLFFLSEGSDELIGPSSLQQPLSLFKA